MEQQLELHVGPVMSSFLTVDSYAHQPDNSQNFNRYTYCMNNPLVYIDPTGEKWWHWAMTDVLSGGFLSSTVLVTAEFAVTTVATTGLTTYSMQFPNTEAGYELQKTISPVAIKFNYGFGSTNHFGADVSLGLPGPDSYRWHCGASYHFGYNAYGGYNGWETCTGAGVRFLGVLSYSGTKFKSGEFSQTTNKISAQVAPYLRLSYENDYMFDIGILGRYKADNGDRWRTAAAKISWGPLEIGTNLFTGDPRLTWKERNPKPMDYPEHNIYGRETYALNKYGDDPDEYRAGVFYVGFGNFRFGRNNEQIRHRFQNRFAHDILMKGDSPYFNVLDIAPRWYFYFGSGTGNSLW